ncbi:MAG: Ig domain-containing protein [Methylococcales bacterium]|nr:Ig domain-containing protein [Methylococcales bacterium]
MPNKKIPPLRQKRRLGLIALAPMMAAIAIAPPIVLAAVDVKVPTCKILTPKTGIVFTANTDVSFSAQATLKDTKASPLTYEWDFSGGVIGELIPNTNPPAYKRPEGLKTTVQFVRDNARYNVHFSAMDSQKRRCESTIEIVVGTPPKGLPDMSAMVNESQKNTPKNGSQLEGKAGDVVVLPFVDMTMQAHGDARYIPNLYVASSDGSFNTLNAQVYSKSRQPQQLTDDDVTLRYAAASNKADPVGTGSINSTSQNYPLSKKAGEVAPFANALIQKTDMWEKLVRPASDKLSKDYKSMSWIDGFPGGAVKPDEGLKAKIENGNSPFVAEHGSFMPGFDSPFVSNTFEDFTTYNIDEFWHTARNIPVIDIDDSGRVNPYPLMRVQAFDKDTEQPIANAATDAVVAVGKDFHCSECHAKGKIAANPEVDFGKFVKAYHSSSEYTACTWQQVCNETITPPTFYDAVDKNGKPSTNLADIDYAAVKNANALHDFYDNIGDVGYMENGSYDKKTGEYGMDGPGTCVYCHATMLNPTQIGWGFNTNQGKKQGDLGYYPSYSQSMHKYHNEIQLDPKDKTKILREESGRPLRWDENKGTNPNTLFPTVDAKGQALPMEESCLRCHSGHREELYRDRMFTAGTTCFDCHGDMSAVGQAHDKPKPGAEGETNRVEWLEQPDCGSCHMGNANLGKAGTGKGGTSEAFSAGVMRRAFDGRDPSATSRKPMSQRFAVQPGKATEIPKDDWVDPQYSTRHSILTVSTPLYRKSKDAHGDVACGACHGGSHEVWPNRNPNANDNVAALELQGHTGEILECNVCHTADSFKNEQDLDGGRFMTDLDADSGVLGGPHNMHPVNDAYWWKTSQNPQDKNADKTTYGGWHNNTAKKPGKDGEDQCSTCHGNDHKGTRLSKTPVDRTFDFSDFDLTKLKAAGFKSSVIKVAAGTQIGCDTCHSIKTSCIGSPAGAECGIASENAPMPTHHDPVITSTPVVKAVMGEAFSYQVKASDADGDALIYSLGLKHAPVKDKDGKIISEMKIDKTGVVTTTWSEAMFGDYKKGPFTFPYSINVSDGKGGYTVQNVEMILDCPKGKSWQYAGGQWDGKGSCVAKTDVTITSKPTASGIDAGGAYSYKVIANDAKNLPITYSLDNPQSLTGITIDGKTGVVKWTAENKNYGQGWFQVKATNSKGIFDVQMVTVTVCVPTKKWDAKMEMCM